MVATLRYGESHQHDISVWGVATLAAEDVTKLAQWVRGRPVVSWKVPNRKEHGSGNLITNNSPVSPLPQKLWIYEAKIRDIGPG